MTVNVNVNNIIKTSSCHPSDIGATDDVRTNLFSLPSTKPKTSVPWNETLIQSVIAWFNNEFASTSSSILPFACAESIGLV